MSGRRRAGRARRFIRGIRRRSAVWHWLTQERATPEPGGDVDTAGGATGEAVEVAAWVPPSPTEVAWWRQSAREISRIIVHHSAGPPDQSVAAVRRFHKDVRGWSDIGYHLCIRQDRGTWRVEPGRPMHLVGAHDGGQNVGSVGVCLFGDYSEQDPPDAAQALLVDVCRRLVGIYDLAISAVEGHREHEPPWSPTVCPGFDPQRLRSALARLPDPVT